jgi:hypothetical protein
MALDDELIWREIAAHGPACWRWSACTWGS